MEYVNSEGSHPSGRITSPAMGCGLVAPVAPLVRPRVVKRARTFLPEFRRRIFVRSDVHPWSSWSKTSNCRSAVPELLSAARPEWFSKGFREPKLSPRQLDRSIQLSIQFSPSANLCFWDGISQRCRSEIFPLDHKSFRFSVTVTCVRPFFGRNENWHAQEDIPSYPIFTAHDLEFEGMSLWPGCPEGFPNVLCNGSSIDVWIVGAISFPCWFISFKNEKLEAWCRGTASHTDSLLGLLCFKVTSWDIPPAASPKWLRHVFAMCNFKSIS